MTQGYYTTGSSALKKNPPIAKKIKYISKKIICKHVECNRYELLLEKCLDNYKKINLEKMGGGEI